MSSFLHASRLEEYRKPFGAMPTDGEVNLSFDVPCNTTNVTLCYTYGLYDFTYHEEPMCFKGKKEDHSHYEVTLMLPHEPGLLFYWFKLRANNEVDMFYVAEADTKDGSGKLYHEPPKVGVEEEKYPYAWQITVFDKNFVTPDKMKGAMIYQIFPDRFARDKKFSFEKMVNASDREERVYHEAWDEEVDIYGKPSTGYLACDFFGGSLTGIKEKLPYIKSLGINIIYLNPIFEARSSHRYDTADYLQVDPILGGNEAFAEFRAEAEKLGIKIIIDGVFSHTGADSKYFNKFDKYEGIGAYKSYLTGQESNFRSWYSFFTDENGEANYASWWGFPDLPNVNEDDLSYRRFIFGEGGVVDTWTKRGAGGIRLDVSDELPDSFIRQMRDTLKKCTNGEGILVGEVWEDASNKCSYGSYRDFMLGRTHDSVMGYTFRKEVLDFLCGYIDASIFNSRMEGYRERYPKEAYYSIMNLISSHDVPRAITMLSKPDASDNREEQMHLKVPEEKMEECTDLMLMAFAFQVGYIGAACTYYGDEILMEGYKDPFNRRTYPWGDLKKYQEKHLENYKKISCLRDENPVLRTGYYKTLYADGDVLVFKRYLDENRKDAFGNIVEEGSAEMTLIINRGEAVDISINGDAVEVKASTKKKISSDLVIEKKKNLTLSNRSIVFIKG